MLILDIIVYMVCGWFIAYSWDVRQRERRRYLRRVRDRRNPFFVARDGISVEDKFFEEFKKNPEKYLNEAL
jgi:hypothetical protein